MMQFQRLMLASQLCIVAMQSTLVAAGGTSVIAQKGQPAHVSQSWPNGAADIVNDAVRTTGWNSWFSEWPNDVNQYAFDVESTDEINRLIVKLAATKSDIRQIRLSNLKEPLGFGWVTSVKEGNGIAVIFSIGDQKRIDEWYKTVRKPFGAIEFLGTPVAVPPTLTIFVGNEKVRLENLKIPSNIDVSFGYAPTVFHKSNTKREREQLKKQESSKVTPVVKIDGKTHPEVDRIQAFIAEHNKSRLTAK